jgi:HSP20 family molecular chaperone IbpA
MDIDQSKREREQFNNFFGADLKANATPTETVEAWKTSKNPDPLGQFLPPGRDMHSTVTSPYRMDLLSTTTHYEIWLEVPGYNKHGLSVTYKDKHIIVEGHTPSFDRQDNLTISQRPRSPSFIRKVKLNTPIKSSETTSEVRDGILYLKIPKEIY